VKSALPKPVVVPITDAAEIASIERGMSDDCRLTDIIGGQDANGNWWAYKFSVERFRQRHAQSQGEKRG
jgi:hypothetical protein